MKKVIVGILLGLMLSQPITVHAQCAMYPRTHDVKMNVNEFTYDEARMLLEIAQAEAGNQGADGMWLVLSTIINRRASDVFPGTIESVIYEEGQYYTAGMGKTEISPECHEALARIEKGDVAPEIVAFENYSSNSLDIYFTPAFTYRDHQFYTLSK